MPHISSKRLNKDLSEKLFKDFIGVLNKAQSKHIFQKIIDEILTSTEKEMLAKRIAIVIMLDSRIPQHSIVDMLNVSPSTVAIASSRIEMHKYKNILNVCKKEKNGLEEIVRDFLTVGGLMPSKLGKRYWKKNFN